MNLTENDVLELFNKTKALLSGHFLLTSGRHSNKYFQCAKVLQYPNYNEAICKNISDFFKDYEIDTVICPAIGGIVVGQEVARQLGKKFIFAERENNTMSLRRGFDLKEGEKVLICEDVVTTGGSVFEVIELAKQKKANIVGVGFIVDRSFGKVKFGYPQHSTVKMEVISYLKEYCPLCKEGLELVKPGSRKNLK
ncbi:MAG: orotate phosphoribosyltransferase [Ignavibacteriales bacterium CG_4_9_14_3_um_filter_30_11]|nr:MAG: orotate phosphoribosyltransferase [Ignavibacteriales bacterium CG_4_9_14_3_um_filter_30_11]